MQIRARFRLIAAALIVTLPAMGAGAQSLFDKLVMPGPLIEGHAKYETSCSTCHEAFSKASQTGLCLGCHTDIAADRSRKNGFHGARPDAANAECKHCHTDHKGRSADILLFDGEAFNHKFADFQLRGAHRAAPCASCHKPKLKYRDAAKSCDDCHQTDEPHKGMLGKRCDSCHTEENWRPAKSFDHSRTRFPLLDSHASVGCSRCHSGERYKGIGTICSNCHELQDVHQGRYGGKCESCHQSTKWTAIRFDHTRQTRFPLRGGHASVKCDSCHKGDLYADKLSTGCVSCHQKDDAHRGQLGPKCESCHNETGWRQKVAFDHDLTRFPLIGKHAPLTCEKCHRTPSFKDTPTKCASCHEDTHHQGRLGPNCATCHNPNGWRLWRFDHGRQTRYPLTGAHEGLNCHLCHKQKNARTVALPTTCYACHAADDAHQGNFGTACETCHTTKSFRSGGIRQ